MGIGPGFLSGFLVVRILNLLLGNVIAVSACQQLPLSLVDALYRNKSFTTPTIFEYL